MSIDRNRVAVGIFWSFAEQFGRRGISILISLILAHFITPNDFGIVAIIAAISSVANVLVDSGLREALIRLEQPTEKDFNTAFYANILFGLMVYLGIFLLAPIIAIYYDESRMVALIRVSGLGVFFSVFQIVPAAILHRNLDFRSQFRVSFYSGLISSIFAILLAFGGIGVWALVIQMLVSSLLTAIILWGIRLWWPSRQFCLYSLKKMYGFGFKLLLSSLLEIVFSNMYVIIIAKIFTTAVAGLYFFAERIRDILISQIVNSIQAVTYPALSTLQSDEARLKSGCREVVLVATFLVFPTMLIFAALAEPMFKVFLPERWWSGAEYLQLMCIAGCLYPLHAINLGFLKIKGRSDLFLYIEIIKKILSVVILVVSIPFGVFGILYGQIVASILAYIPNGYFSKKLIGYSQPEQLADVVPALALSGVVALTVYLSAIHLMIPEVVKFFSLGFGSIVLYVAIANFLNLEGYILTKRTLGSVVLKLKSSRF